MKFGVWYHLRNPQTWRKSPADFYRETLDQIEKVEALGYDSIWVSEHHFTNDDYLPSSLLFLAAVAARTSRVRLGTSVLLLALHHPLRVAEDAAVLDLISGGRLDLGIAAGYRVEEFEGFQVPHKERGQRIEEAIQILQGAWKDESFSHWGRFFSFDNLTVTPKPIQPGGPPLWMGGQSRTAIRRAARLGCNLLPTSVGEAPMVAEYRAALRDFGRDPSQYRVKCCQSLFCTPDPERSWSELKVHFLYQHNLYRRWYKASGDSDASELDSADALPRENYVVDTPDRCASAIRAVKEKLQADEFVFWSGPPGYPIDKATSSLELFAREVMPRFK